MELFSKINHYITDERLNLNRLFRYLNQITKRYLSLNTPRVRATNWMYNHLQLESGDIILDLDCHYGDIWIDNEESLCPSIKIVLLDQHLVNIRLTQQKLLNRSFDYEIQLMNYSHLHYSSNVFDKVIVKLGFNVVEISNQCSMINECHRVLKSNGKGYFLINENRIQASFNNILSEFDSNLSGFDCIQIDKNFINEHVSSLFKRITVHTYEKELTITSAKQLIDFYISANHHVFIEQIVKKHRSQEFDLYLQRKMKQLGSISINIALTLLIGEDKI